MAGRELIIILLLASMLLMGCVAETGIIEREDTTGTTTDDTTTDDTTDTTDDTVETTDDGLPDEMPDLTAFEEDLGELPDADVDLEGIGEFDLTNPFPDQPTVSTGG